MDKFRGWEDYERRISENWKKLVSPEDTVIIAGDVCWAMKLTDTLADFTFLHSLPGKKILMKGNHDYWWTTKKKMDDWLAACGFDDMSILFNNAFPFGGYAVCGTRGSVRSARMRSVTVRISNRSFSPVEYRPLGPERLVAATDWNMSFFPKV